ncbi:MAG: Mur ligase family protein [Parcubacteria group bacterium]|jgi:UDP-N-acetylmuramoyl-tripeptide--D-alanyl-D-alanine ligase
MKPFFKSFIQFYLKILTKFVLWRHKPFIIAVSGTTNKTVVKDYILKFLREKYGEEEVRANPRSFNTEIGLPLAILYLDSGYLSFLKWAGILASGTVKALFARNFPSKLVLELGIESEGDMKYLLGIVNPDIAILTNIETSFSDPSSGLEELFEEFKYLANKIKKDGKLILNIDDSRVRNLKKLTSAEVVTYGFSEDSDAHVSNLKNDVEGQEFDFTFKSNGERVKIKKYGKHFVYAWMVAKIIKDIL